jgi:tryptophanyl-tRNA synthetase
MRPTGRLQIGNYFGALQNWVRLQDDPSYDCFYFVADWHALTSDYADTSAIAENTLQVAIDFLAAGLDPQKSVIFLQSQVPEHAELHLLLSMITPLGWLERIPTYKEALDNIKNKDLHTYGFLGYPVLQTADIVIYSKLDETTGKLLPLFVPVGEDQVAHVEFSRELVATFNSLYGYEIEFESWLKEDFEGLRRTIYPRTISVSGEPSRPFSVSGKDSKPSSVSGSKGQAQSDAQSFTIDDVHRRVREEGVVNVAARMVQNRIDRKYFRVTPVLVEPQVLLTPTPRVPGLDGRKMSKSYGNAITLSESDADIRSKTKVMVTDPARKRRTDPGNPDICPVYDWHKLFSTPERDPDRLDWVQSGCRSAGIGCIECKAAMAENLINWLEPIRARRLNYEQHPKRVLEILDHGSANARKSAQQTMSRVRESILGWQAKRQGLASR